MSVMMELGIVGRRRFSCLVPLVVTFATVVALGLFGCNLGDSPIKPAGTDAADESLAGAGPSVDAASGGADAATELLDVIITGSMKSGRLELPPYSGNYIPPNNYTNGDRLIVDDEPEPEADPEPDPEPDSPPEDEEPDVEDPDSQ